MMVGTDIDSETYANLKISNVSAYLELNSFISLKRNFFAFKMTSKNID